MTAAWDPLAVRVSRSDVPTGGSATFYKYKSNYGGMEPSDAKRLRALEDENGKLKNLLAEQMRPSRALLRNTLPGKGQRYNTRHQFKEMATPGLLHEIKLPPYPPSDSIMIHRNRMGYASYTAFRMLLIYHAYVTPY